MLPDTYDLTYEMEDRYWWYTARRQIVLMEVRRLLDRRPDADRLLDYGCGTGGNLDSLRKITRAQGVDASTQALDCCRKRGLEKLHHLPVADFAGAGSPGGESFDIITMLDVLEHIPDDAVALQRIASWLADDGRMIVTVPTYPWLWSGEDVISEHVRRYTARSFRATCARADLRIERLRYFNVALFPLQAAIILANRAVSKDAMTTSNLKPLPGPINAVLHLLMHREYHLWANLPAPFGGSLVAILARK